MEAEAALEYYDNPRTFTHKDCKQCGRSFATRGAPVAYCSDPCRVRNFEERMGVKWQPLREPSDRWGFMGEPLTVPHEALIVVQAVMAEQAEAEEELSQEVWNVVKAASVEAAARPHEALIVVQAVMAEQAAAEEVAAEPVSNANLNALVEQVYGPVIEETRKREQELLDIFTEFGIS